MVVWVFYMSPYRWGIKPLPAFNPDFAVDIYCGLQNLDITWSEERIRPYGFPIGTIKITLFNFIKILFRVSQELFFTACTAEIDPSSLIIDENFFIDITSHYRAFLLY